MDFREAEGADGDAGGDETDGQQRQQDIFLVHGTPSLPFFSWRDFFHHEGAGSMRGRARPRGAAVPPCLLIIPRELYVVKAFFCLFAVPCCQKRRSAL